MERKKLGEKGDWEREGRENVLNQETGVEIGEGHCCCAVVVGEAQLGAH